MLQYSKGGKHPRCSCTPKRHGEVLGNGVCSDNFATSSSVDRSNVCPSSSGMLSTKIWEGASSSTHPTSMAG